MVQQCVLVGVSHARVYTQRRPPVVDAIALPQPCLKQARRTRQRAHAARNIAPIGPRIFPQAGAQGLLPSAAPLFIALAPPALDSRSRRHPSVATRCVRGTRERPAAFPWGQSFSCLRDRRWPVNDVPHPTRSSLPERRRSFSCLFVLLQPSTCLGPCRDCRGGPGQALERFANH